MPNCNWYGAIDDHLPILDFLFAGGECEIYELSSEINSPLKKFQTVDEILSEFEITYANGHKCSAINLLLRVTACSPPLEVQRIDLNSDIFPKGSHSFKPEGLGFIQFYLGQEVDETLTISHTNHNSRKRAVAWSEIGEHRDKADDWDFEGISRFSAKLNRRIQKGGVAKIGSQAIMPRAFERWKAGIVFGRHHSIEKSPEALVIL